MKKGNRTFEANGNSYTITADLSIERFEKLEELQIEVGFGSDFATLHKALTKIYQDLDKNKLASASVTAHNALNATGRNISKREHPVLLMCTLFCNKDGENADRWSVELAEAKIADWRKEGIPIAFFFQLCREYMKAFTGDLETPFLNISEQKKEEEKSGFLL